MKFDKVKTADCLRKTRLEVDAEGDSSPEPDVTVNEYEPPTAESINCGDELFAYMVGKCYSETDAAALCNEIPDITGITITPNRTIIRFDGGSETTQGTPVYADGATVEEGKNITFRIKVNFKYGEEMREIDASELIPIQDANGEDFYSVSYGLVSDSPLLSNPNPNGKSGSPAKFNAGRVTADTNVNVHALLTLICTGGSSPIKVAEFKEKVKVTIKEECQRIGSDIVLVVDRSGSMMRTDKTDSTRLDGAKEACVACIESANWPYIETDDWNEDWKNDKVDAVLASNKEYDRVAIVSYAGDSKEHVSDWTEIRDFTYIKEEALGGVAELQVSRDCGGRAPDDVKTCATGIGGGLWYAHDLLKYDPRTGKRRVIILITDGYENVCEPGYEPETIAAAIKGDSTSAAADTVIVAIGFRTQAERKVRKCNDTVLTVESYLKTSIATCDLYFDAQDTGDLKNILGQIHEIICVAAKDSTECLGKDYNITAPTVVVDNPCVDARKNFKAFDKWNVCKGYVDIMGGDIWGSLFLTSSQWVGLIGSRGTIRTFPAKPKEPLRNCQKFWGLWDKQFGGIETNKENEVTLDSAKNYELTVNLGGNNAVAFTSLGNKLCSSVRVSVGGTQAGVPKGSHYQNSPDVNGTVDWGFRDDGAEVQDGSGDIPVLCTRKLINPVAQTVFTVPPKGNNIIPYTLAFSGTGVPAKIRVEQFPLGWDTNEYTYSVDDSVWKNHCSLKSVDVSVRDYGGFWTGLGFIDPLSDTSEKLRYESSGADEFIAPPAYGVCLTYVKLEEVELLDPVEQTGTLTEDSVDVVVQDATKLSVGQRVKTVLAVQGAHLEHQTTVASIVDTTNIKISHAAKVGITTLLKFTTQVRTTVFEDSFEKEGRC